MLHSAELYIGVMSGTSLDGIDVALVDFSQGHPQMLEGEILPFPLALRSQLLNLHSGKTTLQEIGELHQALGFLYAQAVKNCLNQWHIDPKQISAIGCHGQTVWHSPPNSTEIFPNSSNSYPFTMQLGNGQIIACQTGITTVADFRNKDMAVGGQGAPLVPAFHRELFSHSNYHTAVLNIGGISNLSLLESEKVMGFDTGTGNALLDLWVNTHLGKAFDENGNWAKSGKVLPNLVKICLQDPYFQLPPPKSTGREYFNLNWLQKKIIQANCEDASPVDIQASLVELTAQCNLEALKKWQKSNIPHRLILCGGGVRNSAIVESLKSQLPQWKILFSHDLGISEDFMEATAFAWMARQRLLNLPSNLPEVTGARRAVSLGVIYAT